MHCLSHRVDQIEVRLLQYGANTVPPLAVAATRVDSKDSYALVIRPLKTRQNLDRGRLARAVLTGQAGNLTIFDLEVNVVDGRKASEALHEPLHFEDGGRVATEHVLARETVGVGPV